MPTDDHAGVGIRPAGAPASASHRAAVADLRIVDVDPTHLAVQRAFWRADSLVIELRRVVDARDDPRRAAPPVTEFRIVGVEPRLWWVSGVDDVVTDVHAGGMVVRLPAIDAHLEFTPGSY